MPKTRFYFNCDLMADVVLPARRGTTVNTEALSYIPANVFRGLLAKDAHQENPQYVQDVENFYNGKLLFGDAHLIIEGKRSHAIPLTWYKEKTGDIEQSVAGKKNGIYLFEELFEKDEFSDKVTNSSNEVTKSYKQLRDGFFVWNADQQKITTAQPESSLTIKSRQNVLNRSAEDGGLFVYRYLLQGQQFRFFVESDDLVLLARLKEFYTRKLHRIGHAKNAEFGLVRITYVKEESFDSNTFNQRVNLYCDTPLCLVDQFGQYTIKCTAETLGVAGAKLDLSKSQIRTRRLILWNGHRKTWDRERLIIDKGSVLHLTLNQPTSIPTTLGVHRAEGFGVVKINPVFLDAHQLKTFSVEKQLETTFISEIGNPIAHKVNSQLVQYLQHQDQTQMQLLATLNKVHQTAQKLKSLKTISNSQWGVVFIQTGKAKDGKQLIELLFNPKEGVLMTGKAAEVWNDDNKRYRQLRKAIEDKELPENQRILFTRKLAREMTKN